MRLASKRGVQGRMPILLRVDYSFVFCLSHHGRQVGFRPSCPGAASGAGAGDFPADLKAAFSSQPGPREAPLMARAPDQLLQDWVATARAVADCHFSRAATMDDRAVRYEQERRRSLALRRH
eukprot:8254915-Pyramimonas_sp.AAC.1